MIYNVAPILIPTLNRFDHFKRCIDSLLECDLCVETDLYIALDCPFSDNHLEGFNKIQDFISLIKGFKSVNVIKREYNFGAHRNIHDAIDFLFKKYKTLILTEDDNVFSKDFLSFTNRCLDIYKDDESIFSVCGYNYPVEFSKSYKSEVYTWQGYSAWGVGLWRDKFQKIDWSADTVQLNVKSFLNNYKNIFRLGKIANHYTPALLHMHNIQQIHGDTYISMYQFLNNMTSVFPVISRVRNMGHDGSGVNCVLVENGAFSTQEIYSGSSNYDIPQILKTDVIIDRILFNHFKTQLKSKIKLFVKLILFNSGFNWPKK